MRLSLILTMLSIAFVSCTKDRDFNSLERTQDTLTIKTGMIRINEIVAKGSKNANEYGVYSDWFELFNTTAINIRMTPGRWYVTDDNSDPRKYEMPDMTLPAFSHTVIWCDNDNLVDKQIHSNFGLAASGEQIGLFYINPDQSILPVDTLTYPVFYNKGWSYGRLPDGSDNWTYFGKPTPYGSNHY